jgi:hypothetical protein
MENSASMEGDVSSGAGAVPSSVSAPNDTLRKLKEQRAKELEN